MDVCIAVSWYCLVLKLCFWMLAYLLFDKPNFKLVQEEARSAPVQQTEGSESALEQAYPRCIALFNESLRITKSSGSIRTVASPTQIGNYILQPGSCVLLPFQQLHMNEEAFGPDATAFKADRFLGNGLVKDPSFRRRDHLLPRKIHGSKRSSCIGFISVAVLRY